MASQPITEVVILTIPTSKRIEDPSTSEGQAWLGYVKGDRSAPVSGRELVRWGRQIENPEKVQVLIDWDSPESQKSSSKTGIPPTIRELSTSPPTTYLANLRPNPPPPNFLSTPIVEYLTLYSSTPSYQEIVAGAEAFEKISLIPAEKEISSKNDGSEYGYNGAVYGRLEEGTQVEKDDGTKAFAFFILLGWESVEHHMKFRETESFKNGIGKLREAAAGGFDMWHVGFKTVA